jgi:cyclopropane-fatty-acyl-phospholipid synthase
MENISNRTPKLQKRSAPRVGSELQFKSVQTLQEYQSVLAFLNRIYLEAGKIDESGTVGDPNFFGNPNYQTFSFHKSDEIVATVSYHIPNAHSFLECVDKGLGFYPEKLPKKETVIEIIRLAIKKDFRGSDVMVLVMQKALQLMAENNRSHVLINSDMKLEDKYRKMGYVSTGYEFESKKTKSGLLKIMSLKLKTFGVYGLSPNPLRWNLLMSSAIPTIIENPTIQMSWAQKFVFFCHRTIQPMLAPLKNYVWQKSGQLDRSSKIVKKLFSDVGITVGRENTNDIQVHDNNFYSTLLGWGSLGLGESYMKGMWDSDKLDEIMFKMFRNGFSAKLRRHPRVWLHALRARLNNQGNRKGALEGVTRHYDLGNDLFKAMLDPRMIYTCAYWKNAENLEQAQERKLELICKKLDLKPGMTLLDIGCGWGGLARYAAENFGVKVTGVTLSKEQLDFAKMECISLPVDFRFQDYRDVNEKFDRIASIGMFEAVCSENYRTFMEVAHKNLKDDGIFLLHTVGRKKSVVRGNDPWIRKYIFPNTQVPSAAQIGKSIDGLFVVEDWENLSVNYEKTLLAWFENFDRNWPALSEKYGPTFYRMWKYYLLTYSGIFRARGLQLWQIALTKEGILGGYHWRK